VRSGTRARVSAAANGCSDVARSSTEWVTVDVTERRERLVSLRKVNGRFEENSEMVLGETDYKLVRKVSHRFYAGKFSTRDPLPGEQYKELLELQEDMPQVVMHDPDSDLKWWMFNGKFYREDENLSPEEIKALLLMRDKKRRKQIERAQKYLQADEALKTSSTGREPIPEDVKIFVWKRDDGKCTKCGSRENLEFDHIIPLAKGGSNTARNLQLLCAKCNREKGANLA